RAGKREERTIHPRRQTVPVSARVVLTVEVAAQGQRGVAAQIVLGDAIEQLALVLVGIDESIAILVGADETPTHTTGLIQLAADIQFGAIVIPASGAGTDAQPWIGRGPLAHQIQRP